MNDAAEIGLDWRLVPAGRFTMGSDPALEHAPDPDEAPRHHVAVGAFRLSRTQVTNEQYREFVAETGHRPPAHWRHGQVPVGRGAHPVVYVTWADASAYCGWAGGALPTEVQWERAARGDDARTWPWGNEAPTPSHAHHAAGDTSPVGGRPAGAGPYGHHDLAGNVLEWTATLLRPYPYDAGDGRDGGGRGARVVRGGSYIHGPAELRCSYRQGLLPGVCDPYVGFRFALPTSADGPPRTDPLDVPVGPVTLGNDPRPTAGPTLPDEAPAHEVVVDAVELSANPVTNAQYLAFVVATARAAPAHWVDGVIPSGLEDHPVTYVDWDDATAFCEWAGVRLPSEAEWEKGARSADARMYPWGSDSLTAARANAGSDLKHGSTSPVASHRDGSSPYGLLDMAGNVWEWVSTAYAAYPYRAGDGREDPASPEQRVLRGGSFASPTPSHLRCARRSRSHRGRRAAHIGFRVARPAGPDESCEP